MVISLFIKYLTLLDSPLQLKDKSHPDDGNSPASQSDTPLELKGATIVR